MAHRENFVHSNPPYKGDKANGLAENIESSPYFPEDTEENSPSYENTKNWNNNDYSTEEGYEDFSDQTSSQGTLNQESRQD